VYYGFGISVEFVEDVVVAFEDFVPLDGLSLLFYFSSRSLLLIVSNLYSRF
jgi:hypothetical protein